MKKGQVSGTIVKLTIALILIGFLLYLGYTYILGTGERVGKLGQCDAQNGKCLESCNDEYSRSIGNALCPGEENKDKVCCLKLPS